MSRQKRRKIYVLVLAAAMILSLMGCGSSNKKSNKTMRVGVVTYTADDPFINAMVEKVKSNLKTARAPKAPPERASKTKSRPTASR